MDQQIRPILTSQMRCPSRRSAVRVASSEVDDLYSTTGGDGEMFDVAAVGRDDCGTPANGRLDHRGVDRTDDIGQRSTQSSCALGRISRQRFDLATIEQPGQTGLTPPTPCLDDATGRNDR